MGRLGEVEYVSTGNQKIPLMKEKGKSKKTDVGSRTKIRD